MTKTRTAVLISGRGSNMAALVAAAKVSEFPADVALVVSNRPDAAGLDHAREAGVPAVVVDHRPHGKDRIGFERELQAVLDEHRISLVCLGGFMRLLTDEFVLHWSGRMLNVHPSLLPCFRGLDPHGQALAAGVRISGATVHFVTPQMDAGPIIAQAAVPVHEDDTRETLAARVLAVEHRIYPMALALVASGRARLDAGRCVIAGVMPVDTALVVPQD
jgi:phosphoribosylglycinamide formyltransferase 1